MKSVRLSATFYVSLIAGLLLPSPGHPQTDDSRPQPGTRIRVYAPLLRTAPFVGTLTSDPGDSMAISMAGDRAAVPLETVARVDTSLGTREAGSGFGVAGLLVGAAAGAAIGAVTSKDDPSASRIVGISLLAGAAGLGAGAYLARRRSGEQWAQCWPPHGAPSDPGAANGFRSMEAGAEDFFLPAHSLHARVTIGEPRGTRAVGRFLDARGDTLTILDGGKELDIPCGEIRRIEVGRGARRLTAEGALIGLAVGAGLGALLGSTEERHGGGGIPSVNFYLGPTGWGVVGGLVGLCWGALIGHKSTHEMWETVPDGRLGVSPDGQVWISAPRSLRVRVTAPHWRNRPWSGTGIVRARDGLWLSGSVGEVRIPTWSVTKVEAAWSGSWMEIPLETPPLKPLRVTGW